MSREIRLLMISAMYENGGNTTHRILDGHPELFVYPFESQLGTRLVQDALTSVFPVKYRWPVFALDGDPQSDYYAIIDEETKVRTRTPLVSKFRDWPLDLSENQRLERFLSLVGKTPRTTGGNVGAFFRATFDSWRDYRRSGLERVYVGYSPIVVVDAARILEDMPNCQVLHVVRNPWSAYADTKKRPVPPGLDTYMLGWMLNQYHALLARERFPARVHILRLEDLLNSPSAAFDPVLRAIGVTPEDLPGTPSWNRQPLTEIYPWGTIRTATPTANRATGEELSTQERQAIRLAASPYIDVFGYSEFLPT